MQLEVRRSGVIFLNRVFQRHMHDGAPFPQAHEGFINGYARNPSGESSASLKLIQITVSLQQGLLLRILRVFLVAGDPESQAKSALLAILQGLRTHHCFAFFPKTCGA
jgi:hypothetical protein